MYMIGGHSAVNSGLLRCSNPAFQPVEPGLHPISGSAAEREEDQGWVDFPGIIHCLFQIEIHIGQQIGFADHTDLRGMEHVGVLQGLIVALGYAKDDHTPVFTKIEHGRTDKITYIFDEKSTVPRRFELLKRMQHHMGIEVTPLAGIDLHRFRTRGPYAVGIPAGILITFDHVKIELIFEPGDGLLQKCGFTRPRRTHQIYGKNVQGIEIAPVALGKQIVLVEDVPLKCNHTVLHRRPVMVMMVMAMSVIVMVMVGMLILMPVVMTVSVLMAVIMIIAVAMSVTMRMIMTVAVTVFVGVIMAVVMVMTFCITASAGYTHCSVLFRFLFKNRC